VAENDPSTVSLAIEDTLAESYVNYAMSVHELAQALKDARARDAGLTEVKLKKKRM